MGFVLDELWDWIAISVYQKYGWKGAVAVVVGPIVMLALIAWLLVTLLS